MAVRQSVAAPSQVGYVGIGLAALACFATQGISLNIFPAQLTALEAEFGLSGGEIGLLVSASSIVYALVQVPVGLLTTRWRSSHLLLVAAFGMALTTALTALAPSYPALLLARAALGLFAGMIVPVGTHLVAESVAPRYLARTLNMFGSGWGAGSVLAFFLLAPLLPGLGWRGVGHVSALAIAVLGLVALAIFLRSPGAPASNGGGALGAVPGLLVSRRLWLLILVNLSALATFIGMANWMPIYLGEKLQAPPVLASQITGVMAIFWLLAPSLGGMVAGRLGRFWVIFLSMAACVLLPLLVALSSSELVIVVLMAGLGWFSMFYFGALFSLVPRVVPGELAGTATGVLNGASWIGPFLTPPLVGIVRDATGGNFVLAFGTISAISLLGVLGALAIRAEFRD